MERFTEHDPALIKREDTLLVVVDVQERLFSHIADNEAMEVEIKRLIDFAGIIDMPVVFAEQIKLGAIITSLRAKDSSSPLFIKETFSCYGSLEFKECIESYGPSNIILTGIETHVCVLQTAMAALEEGLRVQVVADAVGSRSAYNKEVALRRIACAGGEVTCAESLIFELMERAGSEEFREVLKLLKD
jgi:nicotinamidase-related amidase